MDIAVYMANWKLADPELIAETATSHVYKVGYCNSRAVLKLLTPRGLKSEAKSAQALKHFDGNGAVRVLRSDEQALLLEHLEGEPITSMVKTGNDKGASQGICDVLDRLHRSSSSGHSVFEKLEERFASLFRRAQQDTDSFINRAARMAKEVLKSPGETALLHGDIHHTNIIRDRTRGFVAIDPQPVVGERTYDIANAFFNPDDIPNVVERPERVLSMAEIFARRLGVNQQRVLQFALAHGGLSISWQLDCNENPVRRKRICTLIESLLDDTRGQAPRSN